MDKILSSRNLKKMLVKKKDFLIKQIQDEQQKIEPAKMTNPDNADLASDYAYRSRQTSLLDSLERQLSDVENALDRLAKGTYGICANCGNAILPERLFALPQAELCINCQRESDTN